MQYNQYHKEDGNTFVTETRIYFGQCNNKKELNLSQVLQFCADLATEDFAQRGMSRDRMVSEGFAMLVSRSAFRIHRLPKEGEEIVITTREEKPEAIQMIRSYDFETKSGEKLITGKSQWLFAHPQTRRIIPVSKFTMREPNELEIEHDCPNPGKIKIPENLEKFGEQQVLPSLIDGNNHLTNSKYSDLAMDYLPMEFYRKPVKDFRLNYCKEAYLGDMVEIFGAINREENKITVTGKNKGETSFEAEIIYYEM